MILFYPIAYFHSSIKNITVKHLISFILGFSTVQFFIGREYIFAFGVAIISYLMMLLLPKKLSPYFVILFAMISLTAEYIYIIFIVIFIDIFMILDHGEWIYLVY